MKEVWVKIGLTGADPQLGTLQGRLTEESFDQAIITLDVFTSFNKAIEKQSPVKLFDPIIFRAQRTTNNEVLLGALPLAETMPVIEDNFIILNPANILWWASLEETEDWKRVVTTAIHHIELASGGEDLDGLDSISNSKGPKLVK